MSQFKTYMGIPSKDELEIIKMLEQEYDIPAGTLTSESNIYSNSSKEEILNQLKLVTKDDSLTWGEILHYPGKIIIRWIKKNVHITPDPDPEGWPTKRAAEIGLPALIAGTVMMVLTWLLNTFVGIQLNKFAAIKMEKTLQNQKLYDWIQKTINQVYIDHPEYKPMGLKEFKKTSIWTRFAAEWRDKTAKENVINITDAAFNTFLLKICRTLPLPFFTGFMYCIAARFVLTYLGCKMGSGALFNLVIDFEGNSLHLGLTFTRLGFEITKPILYVTRQTDKKMVKVNLPDIPRSLYRMDAKSAKKIITKIGGKHPDIKKFKKEVARVNDLE